MEAKSGSEGAVDCFEACDGSTGVLEYDSDWSLTDFWFDGGCRNESDIVLASRWREPTVSE